MDKSTADILICGAGIAGIAAAYHLSVKHGIKKGEIQFLTTMGTSLE